MQVIRVKTRNMGVVNRSNNEIVVVNHSNNVRVANDFKVRGLFCVVLTLLTLLDVGRYSDSSQQYVAIRKSLLQVL